MNRYVIDGRFWCAGDNVYIETEEKDMNGLPTEVCLNDFLKEHIKEETEITIVIDVKNKHIKE